MIVDWNKNCKNIFNTHHLKDDDPYDKKLKVRQEIIFLQYLEKIKKMPEKEIYRQWENIDNGIANIFASEEEQKIIEFSRLLVKSRKIKYDQVQLGNDLKPIVIYWEEINFLNNLNVPLWVKQYWGCLLFYYKFASQLQTRVQKTKALNSWCVRQVDYKDQRYGSECQDLIASYKRKLKENIIQDILQKRSERFPVYKPAFLCTTGITVATYDCLDQIGNFLQLINNKTVFPSCGKSFDKKSKTKRVLCDECYKIYRRQYQSQNKQKNRDVDRKTVFCFYDKGENNTENFNSEKD